MEIGLIKDSIIDADYFAGIFVDKQRIIADAYPHATRWRRKQRVHEIIAEPVVALEIGGGQTLPICPAPWPVAVRRPVGRRAEAMRRLYVSVHAGEVGRTNRHARRVINASAWSCRCACRRLAIGVASRDCRRSYNAGRRDRSIMSLHASMRLQASDVSRGRRGRAIACLPPGVALVRNDAGLGRLAAALRALATVLMCDAATVAPRAMIGSGLRLTVIVVGRLSVSDSGDP